MQSDAGPLVFRPGKAETTGMKATQVSRCWESDSDAMRANVSCTVNFDGCVDYRAKLTALKELHTRDACLDIPMRPEIAEYFMGLGRRGGFAPQKHEVEMGDQPNY